MKVNIFTNDQRYSAKLERKSYFIFLYKQFLRYIFPFFSPVFLHLNLFIGLVLNIQVRANILVMIKKGLGLTDKLE